MPAIEINNISKNYKEVKALDQINITITDGELFGLIGPDGAGKTTLFRILTTLLLPDSGTAKVCGLDTVADYLQIRTLLGYMPGRFSLYQDLTVEENLQFFAAVFGTTIAQNYHLIKEIYTQIEPFKNRKAGKLSGGMKQKLALSCALIHKPKVLFLDEPTTGVDAVSRKEFWDILKRLKEQGITILVSTPYMDEASLCDKVALIQNGTILQTATPEQIISGFPDKLYKIKSDNMYQLLKIMRINPNIKSVHLFGQYIHFTQHALNPDLQVLHNYLIQNGLTNLQIEPILPGIEDCFMNLMHTEQ